MTHLPLSRSQNSWCFTSNFTALAYQMWLSKRWYHWYLFWFTAFFSDLWMFIPWNMAILSQPIKHPSSLVPVMLGFILRESGIFHRSRASKRYERVGIDPHWSPDLIDIQNGQVMQVPGLVNIQLKRTGSHGPVEIVGLPINSMVIFQYFPVRYVSPFTRPGKSQVLHGSRNAVGFYPEDHVLHLDFPSYVRLMPLGSPWRMISSGSRWGIKPWVI